MARQHQSLQSPRGRPCLDQQGRQRNWVKAFVAKSAKNKLASPRLLEEDERCKAESRAAPMPPGKTRNARWWRPNSGIVSRGGVMTKPARLQVQEEELVLSAWTGFLLCVCGADPQRLVSGPLVDGPLLAF
jgi:hypothetical protein